MDADEKLAALERVYGDVMLNTEKEAAARIMVSEQKVQCFQKELHVVKENGILAMMKLKKSMDSKVDGGSNTENLGLQNIQARDGPGLHKLCYKWGTKLTPAEVADKVKYFFIYNSINRHKMTVQTPSYHAESCSPEDNRFDLRQYLYNVRWPYKFRKIDELVNKLAGERVAITRSNDGEKMNVTADGVMVGWVLSQQQVVALDSNFPI